MHRHRLWNQARPVAAITVCAVLITGCVSVPKRNPLPEHLIEDVGFIVGRERAAAWGDERPHYVDGWFSMTQEQLRKRYAGVIGKPHHPAGLDWAYVSEMLDVPEPPHVYVIRNSRLHPEFEPVNNRVIPIVGRSVTSLIRTQGIGNMYELYLLAKRDGLDYHLAYIPKGVEREKSEQFDPEYMKALFDLGYQMAENGYPWDKVPPGYFSSADRED